MNERLQSIKELWGKLVSGSAEARYKAVLRINSVVMYLMRYVVLIAIGYIVLYPLLYMISSAFRTKASFLDPSTIWVPKEFTLYNFEVAFRVLKYGQSIWNTISYEIVAAVIQIISCALVAYGLARFEFWEKKILIFFLFLTIMIPSQMMIIPIVTTYSDLDFLGLIDLISKAITGTEPTINILNTVWTFYLPALMAVGIRSGIIIYIYMQFFKGLPKELEEAAWIDGAGPLKTFIRIALPSSGVVIMTVSVFSIIWHWNDYYLASMYLYSQNFTLAVMLYDIEGLLITERVQVGADPETIAYIMASCLVFILPVLIMYMFLQKKFVKSIDRVGITG